MDHEKTTALVPFGKYKGQPVELLLADKPYLDWLTSQDWFRQKYQNIYAVIINYSGKPVETPEHNRMQVRFLNPDYQLKLAFLLLGSHLFRFDQSHFDQFITTFTGDYLERLKQPLSELDGSKLLRISSPVFEDKGADVSYDVRYGYGDFGVSDHQYNQSREFIERLWACQTSISLRIELKPSVGDDFPSVLRQMKSDRSNVLVLQAYTGTGATQDEFINFFRSEEIQVVFEGDIDRVVLPRLDERLKVKVGEL